MENGYGLTKWAPTSPCVREPSNTAVKTNDEQMLSHFSLAFRATSATVPGFFCFRRNHRWMKFVLMSDHIRYLLFGRYNVRRLYVCECACVFEGLANHINKYACASKIAYERVQMAAYQCTHTISLRYNHFQTAASHHKKQTPTTTTHNVEWHTKVHSDTVLMPHENYRNS